jgi:hypothetical protein
VKKSVTREISKDNIKIDREDGRWGGSSSGPWPLAGPGPGPGPVYGSIQVPFRRVSAVRIPRLNEAPSDVASCLGAEQAVATVSGAGYRHTSRAESGVIAAVDLATCPHPHPLPETLHSRSHRFVMSSE